MNEYPSVLVLSLYLSLLEMEGLYNVSYQAKLLGLPEKKGNVKVYQEKTD